MDKNKKIYWISRDNMETWKEQTVRTFDMRKHKNGETSELDCFLNVSLTALCFWTIKNDKSLKSKGGKQGLKVHICFDNANGYTEEIKTALDAYKIVLKHTEYKKSLSQFHRDFKKNCENGKEWQLNSTNGKFNIYLLSDDINYKYNSNISNNKSIVNINDMETEKQLFIVNVMNDKEQIIKDELKPDWSKNNVSYCDHYKRYGTCPAAKRIKVLPFHRKL
jgi:hypothetical protein